MKPFYFPERITGQPEEKVYVKFVRSRQNLGDNTSPNEVWENGTKPRQIADGSTIYVYDCADGRTMTGGRIWDGVE